MRDVPLAPPRTRVARRARGARTRPRFSPSRSTSRASEGFSARPRGTTRARGVTTRRQAGERPARASTTTARGGGVTASHDRSMCTSVTRRADHARGGGYDGPVVTRGIRPSTTASAARDRSGRSGASPRVRACAAPGRAPRGGSARARRECARRGGEATSSMVKKETDVDDAAYGDIKYEVRVVARARDARDVARAYVEEAGRARAFPRRRSMPRGH